jgi:putative protease
MERAAELLMPAGSLEKLKVAILYGADAVYMGTPDLSLRTRSNFTLDGVLEGVAFAHDHGKRAHLTLNLFSHNRDIEKLPDSVAHLSEIEARLHVKGASLKVIKPELDTQRRSAASSST